MINTKKLKVLIFHPALATYRVDLFNELSKNIQLKVIFLRENLIQPFDQIKLRESLICDYDYLLTGFEYKERLFRWGIRKMLSEELPDVVVCSEFSPLTLWLSLLKYAGSNHNWKLCVWTDDNPRMIAETNWIKNILKSVVLKKTDSLIVCNSKVKLHYQKKGFVTGLCYIIRDENLYRKQLLNLIPLANNKIQKYSLTNKKIILFVGRLVKIKGVDRLIQAFTELIKTIPEAMLVIIGDGSERVNLEKQVARSKLSDHIRFEGWLEGEDLLLWYLIVNLFVLPSHHECFGAVVNEALLAGVPVMCSECAGASDLINNGKNGFVFDPYNNEEMAFLMSKLLYDSSLCGDIIHLRPNLMPYLFVDSVHGFISAVTA